jgi:hypothetical protein
VAPGSIQPLTEMSTRNLPAGKGRPPLKADLTAICEPIVSQPYGPSRPVTGRALPLLLLLLLFVIQVFSSIYNNYITGCIKILDVRKDSLTE